MPLLDSLEARFGKYAISGLLTYIASLVALTFVLFKLNPHFFELLELYPDRVMAGEVWRLVSYIFVPTVTSLLPFPDWFNAAFYVLFMLWVGQGLEHAMGAFKLNVFCLLTLVGITIAAFVFGTAFSHYMFMQAVFLAFARFYPEQQITLYFILPVKVKWLAWFDAALLCYQFTFMGNSFRGALIAALIAYLLFFGREIWTEARLRQQVRGRRTKFERAVAQTPGESLHRCEVCGRTEHVAPDLEFRVAKDGHEYCTEHLPKTPAATS
jgi:hypothetical protein